MSKTPDNGINCSEITFPAPESLLLIEAFHLGRWVPAMVGNGIKLCVPNIEAANRLMTQIRQIHIANSKPIPLMHFRPLSDIELIDIKAHMKRHSQSSDFGVDMSKRILGPPPIKKPSLIRPATAFTKIPRFRTNRPL